jgi:hypothetical protein
MRSKKVTLISSFFPLFALFDFAVNIIPPVRRRIPLIERTFWGVGRNEVRPEGGPAQKRGLRD